MKKKKSCYNCKYLATHSNMEFKCTNNDYLDARANFKSTGRALSYCTWYEREGE